MAFGKKKLAFNIKDILTCMAVWSVIVVFFLVSLCSYLG